MASSPTRLAYRNADEHKCVSEKRCYGSKREALDGAERLMELGRVAPGCHITPYLCDDCGTWHVWNRPIVRVDKRGYPSSNFATARKAGPGGLVR